MKFSHLLSQSQNQACDLSSSKTYHDCHCLRFNNSFYVSPFSLEHKYLFSSFLFHEATSSFKHGNCRLHLGVFPAPSSKH